MSRYAQKAVDALHATFASGFAEELRLIETEESLDEGELRDPVDYVKAFTPADNRSPLVQIYELSGVPISHRNRLTAVECTVAVTYNGGTDIEADELRMRRYLTAMIRVIELDTTLGGRVTGAIWTDFERGLNIIDEASTRHVRALGVEMRVHDP